jgi:sulfate/thiosulfate transport system permease protein
MVEPAIRQWLVVRDVTVKRRGLPRASFNQPKSKSLMAGTVALKLTGGARKSATGATTEPRGVRWLLIGVTLAFLGLFLFMPLLVVFTEALSQGWTAYWDALADPDTLSAIRMTLLAAAIVVPINTIFGVLAAWAIAKFQFVGKSVLITLIDLPYSVSPVIAGMVFVLVFGRQGWCWPWLEAHDIRIVYAPAGIVIATLFVTFPFVARELIPLMQAQGTEEEEAARVLGAGGLQTFWRVTLPNIKWGLLYGVILCNARAMGEFGAVSVVVGNMAWTNTMPLHVERLYKGGCEADLAAAFAVASLLALLALITLVLKSVLQWKTAEQLSAEELGYTGD